MKKIKLFEIPIYSMKKEIYEKRCYNYIKRYANQTTPSNNESFYNYLKSTTLIHRPWLYNQIVGYIVISFYQNSIWFDEYSTLDKRIHAIGNTKHYIEDMMLNGYHFYVSNNMTDAKIKQDIIEWITSIEKDILKKPWTLEKELFINQLNYIDIRKMIDMERD